MNILISACLLGINCRYDGKNHYQQKLEKLTKKHTLIPICPEQLGGLPTPRDPVELKEVNGIIRAVTKDGADKTQNFRKGAEETKQIAQMMHCKMAILKSKSPSCGVQKIYNGDFNGTLAAGNGMTAQTLLDSHIQIYTEETLDELFSFLEIYSGNTDDDAS